MIKLFSSLLIVFLSLSSLKAVERNSTISAVASFSILGDLVSEIGGKNVKVKSLVGPNGDAHVFQPTPVTNKTVVEADIVFLNGLNFEGWLIRLMEASDYKGVVVVATEGIKPRNVSDKKDNQTITDPHAWHRVEFYKTYAQNVAKGLEKIDPSNKKYYEERLKNYLKKLSDLETWIHKEVNKIPLNKRKVITAHDAFGYFGEAYGIKFLAPVGVSTESKASAHDVSHLIEQIRSEDIRAVFIENISDRKLMEQIAEETQIDISENILYSDALSDADGPAANYLDMMHYNVEKIIQSMQDD